MSLARLAPFMFAAIIGFVRPMSAQEVTGRVTTGADIGVSAAVVSMLDSAGGTLVRALTDGQGRYRLPPNARMRELRVTRIGFRPRNIPVRATGAPIIVPVRLERLPTMLAAVRVVDQPGCPRRRDRQEAFALWEQAQAGLLSTVVARQESNAALERFTFYRIVGERRRNILTQLVQQDTARGNRPFGAARSAREFVERGFQDPTTGTFFAPDADVLLDDAFSRGYCFRLADRDRNRPLQVGLRFEPAVRSRGRIDIDGTLWIDTAARALSDLEYRYLGLSAAASALRLGGKVAFAAMPPGYPAISEWTMRVAAPSSRPIAGEEIRSVAAVREALEAHELGGLLARARWPDTSWSARLGRVSGRVLRDTVPAPGVVLRLVGTPYRAISDSAGVYAIDALLPGRYTFAVPDSTLNALGFELTRGQSFESDRDSRRVDVVLPVEEDFIGSKCGRSTWDTSSVLIAARAVDASGALAANAHVTLSTYSSLLRAGSPIRRPVSLADSADAIWERVYRDLTRERSIFYLAQDGATGSGGAVFICKAPAKSLLRIDAASDGEYGRAIIMTDVPRKRIYTPLIRMKPVSKP